MECLVTGGAGFIGSHLVDYLLKLGHNVTIIDDFSTGFESNLEEANNFASNGQLRILKGSILNLRLVSEAVRGKDVIFHYAAQINVRKSTADPLFDENINIKGSLLLYEQAVKAEVSKIIFAASGGAMYGEPASVPVGEKEAMLPLSPYGISKMAAEQYLLYFGNNTDTTTISLRFANIYGPRQDPKGEAGVISIFLEAINSGNPLLIFGEGKDTRDYVSVRDVLAANQTALDFTKNGAFNIGTGKESSVLDLIDIMEKVTEITPERNFLPPRPGEVHRIALNSALAQKQLGWVPKVGLEEGIQEVWDWFKG